MSKIVTFGEVLMRLTPLNHRKIKQSTDCQIFFGGSEANVAGALANYGLNSVLVTKLPTNALGQACHYNLQALKINTSFIRFGGERLGIYLFEKGYTPCSGICTYDRDKSAMQTASPKDFNWNNIFQDASWFHVSGITPALSPTLYRIVLQACTKARQQGIIVSCDINYRSKLWTKEEASAKMHKICQQADVLFINEEEAAILGFDVNSNELMQKEIFAQMADYLLTNRKYPASVIATAARVYSPEGNLSIKAMSYHDGKIAESNYYPLQDIDSVGAGDAFAAGIIYNLLHKADTDQTVNFAAAACALKHSIPGDINFASVEETRSFLSQQKNLNIKR